MTTTATPFIPVLGAESAADSIIERHRAVLETMGPVFQATVPSRAAAGESEPRTLYRLSLAQTCFLTAKLDTPSADLSTAAMAEVYALFVTGKLVAADPVTADQLANAQAREARPTA